MANDSFWKLCLTDGLASYFTIAIDVTVPWFVSLFVCHVRALCSNGRRYLDTMSFAQDIMPHQDHVKICLTSVNVFLPKFCPTLTHPC